MLKEIDKIRNAKGQLKKLADGEYHSLTYELTQYQNQEIHIACRVYINNYGSIVSPTWDDALQKMRDRLRYRVKDRKETTP